MTTTHTSGAADLPEVFDAIADSQYLAGVKAGWNAAQANDPNTALRKIHESRAGYLKPLRDAQRAALAAGQAVAPAVPTGATGGEWRQPTTAAQRMGDVLQLLCGGKRPPDDMVTGWLDELSEELQDFCATHGPVWAQGIALIDLAMVAVEQPTEGVSHETAARPAPPAMDGGDAEDAKRWRMLPAFFEEYQIDAMKLYRDIDAARAAQKEDGKS